MKCDKRYKKHKKNIDKEFRVIFEQAEQVAAKVGTQPPMLGFPKLSHSGSRLLFLIPTVVTKLPLAKMHTNKSLKCMGVICLIKMWLTLSYCLGNSNGLNVMRNRGGKQ